MERVERLTVFNHARHIAGLVVAWTSFLFEQA